jgi:hypothetical protein
MHFQAHEAPDDLGACIEGGIILACSSPCFGFGSDEVAAFIEREPADGLG